MFNVKDHLGNFLGVQHFHPILVPTLQYAACGTDIPVLTPEFPAVSA